MGRTGWALVDKSIGRVYYIKTKRYMMGTQFKNINKHFIRVRTKSTITINNMKKVGMTYAWPDDVITIKGRTYIVKRITK